MVAQIFRRKLEEQERESERKRASERSIKDQRRMEREQRRRLKKKAKLFASEEEEMAHMIAVEERKLVIAQRKLESIRILDELLERVKVNNNRKEVVVPSLKGIFSGIGEDSCCSLGQPHRGQG